MSGGWGSSWSPKEPVKLAGVEPTVDVILAWVETAPIRDVRRVFTHAAGRLVNATPRRVKKTKKTTSSARGASQRKRTRSEPYPGPRKSKKS